MHVGFASTRKQCAKSVKIREGKTTHEELSGNIGNIGFLANRNNRIFRKQVLTRGTQREAKSDSKPRTN